jgi:uncharacterized protein (TIGR02147 family)
MINIYQHTSYRDFLKEFYENKKQQHSYYSYQYIADKAGYKSKSFFRDLILGNKNLTIPSLFKLNQVLQLGHKEFEFLSNLVHYEQGEGQEEKDYFLDKIIHSKVNSKLKKIALDQYEFYSEWYHNVVRELVLEFNIKTPEAIATTITPNMSIKDAKSSLLLLERLKLIQKTKNGYFSPDKIITTGNYVTSKSISTFHHKSLALAQAKLKDIKGAAKDYSAVVLSISKENYPKLQKEIQKFRKRILHLADLEENAQKVMQINVQMYPLSQTINTPSAQKS